MSGKYEEKKKKNKNRYTQPLKITTVFILTFLVTTYAWPTTSRAANAKTFEESVLVKAFERGNSLVIAKILSVRRGKEEHISVEVYFYKAEIVKPIIMGDLTKEDLKEPIEFYAGVRYGDTFEASSSYAIFIAKQCPHYLDWVFCDDVVKLKGLDDKNLALLQKKAEKIYAKTAIRKFRENKPKITEPTYKLPEGIAAACEKFRANPDNRAEFGRTIYGSDLGSQIDRSRPYRSNLTYLPPKIILSREQIPFLFGKPALKCGWSYKWFCGQDKSRPDWEKYVGVLSVTFDSNGMTSGLLYNLDDKLRWLKTDETAGSSSYEKFKEGFKLTLIPLSEIFVIGKPMLFRLEMQNISNETLEPWYMTSSTMVNDPLEIKDSNSNHVPYMDTSYQTFGGPKIFEPNETVVLADNYDVGSQYHIIKPGRYSFQFRGEYGLNPSNIVEIDIKPGELSPLEEIVEKLKPVLPKGWGLTRSLYPFDNLPEGETRKTIMFHLIGKYPPKTSGGQIIALAIFVNPTPSFLEKKYFNAELWGESIWGPVYLKNSDAELLWPDYKEQIKNALNIQESKDKKQ